METSNRNTRKRKLVINILIYKMGFYIKYYT